MTWTVQEICTKRYGCNGCVPHRLLVLDSDGVIRHPKRAPLGDYYLSMSELVRADTAAEAAKRYWSWKKLGKPLSWLTEPYGYRVVGDAL